MVIALFDENNNNQALLTKQLSEYALRKNLEFYLLHVSKLPNDNILREYASGITFAFVSLDMNSGIHTGEVLSRNNPECYLCYYKSEPFKLIRLMHTRPFEFILWNQQHTSLNHVMDDLLLEFAQSRGSFCLESKKGIRYYAVQQLLYIQSDLKYVNIKTVKLPNSTEDTVRIYTKLSEIKATMEKQGCLWCFVQVHKSYLINLIHIQYVNKQMHTIFLSSGEEIPMSEMYYQSSLDRIREFPKRQNQRLIGRHGVDE